MFHINKEEELTTALLQKMIMKFHTSVKPKMLRYKDYYDGIQEILKKSYSDSTKPCSKTVTNYAKNIVDSYCGYLASGGYISYSSEQDIQDIMDVLEYNDYQEEDSSFLLDALVYGVATELMYIDSDSKTRFRLINPTQCFGIYEDSLSNDLLYFVRMYKVSEWDETDRYFVDVYSDYFIRHYGMMGMGGQLEFISEEPHYFSQCPANIFYLPDEKSIFDCIMSLQDAYNELLGSEIDDFSAFVDAFLTITGASADAEQVQSMKENRVLLLPDGSSASFLTKNTSDTQIENILKRLNENIYKIAACPDFSSEAFVGGVSSGIAIRYRLTGMETRATIIESLMKKALQRRIEIISGIASLKLGEEVFRDIKIIFKRNVPVDNNEIINTVNALRGVVSSETLLSMIPNIENPQEEVEKVKAEKQENISLYSFGNNNLEEE